MLDWVASQPLHLLRVRPVERDFAAVADCADDAKNSLLELKPVRICQGKKNMERSLMARPFATTSARPLRGGLVVDAYSVEYIQSKHTASMTIWKKSGESLSRHFFDALDKPKGHAGRFALAVEPGSHGVLADAQMIGKLLGCEAEPLFERLQSFGNHGLFGHVYSVPFHNLF